MSLFQFGEAAVVPPRGPGGLSGDSADNEGQHDGGNDSVLGENELSDTAPVPIITRGRSTSRERGALFLRSTSPERSASPERSSIHGVSVPTTAGAIKTSGPLALTSTQQKLSAGSIASITIAIIGVLALAIGLLFFLRRRRRQASNRYSTGSWEDGPFYREKGAVHTTQQTLGAPNTVRPIFETSNQLGNYGGVGAQETTGIRRGAANSIRSNSSRSFRSYFPSSAWDQPKRKSVSASLRGLIAPLERSFQTA